MRQTRNQRVRTFILTMNKIQINVFETEILELFFKGLADVILAMVGVPKFSDDFENKIISKLTDLVQNTVGTSVA